MQRIIEILFNALPEAIDGLIAAGIIALLSYLFVKRLRKATPQEKAAQELLPEPPLPEIYSTLPSRTEFIGRKKERVVLNRLRINPPKVGQVRRLKDGKALKRLEK